MTTNMTEERERELTQKARQEMAQAPVLASLYGYDAPLPALGGWTVDHDGVYLTETNHMGAVKILTACRAPVVVTGLTENVGNESHGVELAFLTGGKWSFIDCRRSEIADRARIVLLSDKGLPVTSENAKYLVRYLDCFMALNTDFIPKRKVISHLGWHHGKFIPYCGEPRLTDACEVNRILVQAGSFEEWQSHVKGLIEGNPHLRTFLSASFASALLEPLGVQNFMTHLWGRTGSGKSLALMLAASVWSQPDGKLFGTLNGTLNFMQSQASMLRNLPLCLDELQTVRDSTGNYDKLIMQLGVGVGRGRANREGNARSTAKWYNVALCTGEEPIIKPNSGAGAVNRVLQICVDGLEGDLIPNGSETARVIRSHYGTAGVRFIAGLTDGEGVIRDEILNGLRQMFDEYLDEVRQAAPTSGKQAAIVAAILTADTFADVTVYGTGSRLQLSEVTQFLASNDEIYKPVRAKEYIRNMISIHVNDFVGFFKDSKTGEYVDSFGHQPSGKVFGKLTETTATVNRHVLVQWLEEGGYSFDAVKKAWADTGFLMKNSQGRYLARPPAGMTGTFVRLLLTDREESWVQESEKHNKTEKR